MDKLIKLIKKFKNPSVIGLDTKLEYIPQHIKNNAISKYGNNFKAACFAMLSFNKKIVDEIKDIVPAVKLQMACYETFGSEGIKTLEETAKYAQDAGLYVIFDGKRNDIQSSMESYSNAYLGKTKLLNGEEIKTFHCNSLTINLYLGKDSLSPVLKNCEKYNKTAFVLFKTSNPSSEDVQNIKTKENVKVYEKIGKICEELSKKTIGELGYSKIGAVVGATQKEELKTLREMFKNTFFLIPGYGAQKGNAKDISLAFENGIGGIVNSSRKILTSWQKNNIKEEDFAKQAREEAIKMRDELNSYI